MQVYKPIFNVVLREVPGEVSIGFMVSGCKQGCNGCSYKSLDKHGTEDLSLWHFEEILKDNQGLASCIVWMGGEWMEDLPEFLARAKSLGYKNCLYTGMKTLGDIPSSVSALLDFAKTGRWEGKPLTDVDSNQKFWDVQTKTDITHKFQIDNK